MNKYDLLITDNSMPKISGLELLEKLRDARLKIPTIIVSGSLPIDDPSLNIGAALVKPVSTESIADRRKRTSMHRCL